MGAPVGRRPPALPGHRRRALQREQPASPLARPSPDPVPRPSGAGADRRGDAAPRLARQPCPARPLRSRVRPRADRSRPRALRGARAGGVRRTRVARLAARARAPPERVPACRGPGRPLGRTRPARRDRGGVRIDALAGRTLRRGAGAVAAAIAVVLGGLPLFVAGRLPPLETGLALAAGI